MRCEGKKGTNPEIRNRVGHFCRVGSAGMPKTRPNPSTTIDPESPGAENTPSLWLKGWTGIFVDVDLMPWSWYSRAGGSILVLRPMVTPSALPIFDDEKAPLRDALNLQETTNRILEGGGPLGEGASRGRSWGPKSYLLDITVRVDDLSKNRSNLPRDTTLPLKLLQLILSRSSSIKACSSVNCLGQVPTAVKGA